MNINSFNSISRYRKYNTFKHKSDLYTNFEYNFHNAALSEEYDEPDFLFDSIYKTHAQCSFNSNSKNNFAYNLSFNDRSNNSKISFSHAPEYNKNELLFEDDEDEEDY